MTDHIDGEWINQNGSTMQLHAQPDGTLSGFYRTRKGRSASGKAYPLTGVINQEVIAFNVNWLDDDVNLESITAFSGRLQRQGADITSIHTIWVLVRRWENEERTKETGVWNAFLTNSDVFTRADDQPT